MSGPPGRVPVPPQLPALAVLGVHGLGEVRRDDDLAALIAERIELRSQDVVVVSQKIVSKAEGAVTVPPPGEDPVLARRRIARQQARRVVADAPWALIVETRHGFVCANAGIDASNVPGGGLALLPHDPDASARRLRAGLREHAGVDVGVIVSDTFGRPWRIGQTDVAIGLAGLTAVRDERGLTDREGNVLEVTEAAVADELAAAADLVRRKGEGVPVVVIRGFDHPVDEEACAQDLVRPSETDLFRWGRGMLAAGLAEAGPEPAGSAVAPDDLGLLEAVAERAGGRVRQERSGEAPTVLAVSGDRMAAGLVVAALRDLGYAASWEDGDGHVVVRAGRSPESLRPADQ